MTNKKYLGPTVYIQSDIQDSSIKSFYQLIINYQIKVN